ncbi:uncharacterized protein K02A2.6-like [Dreissena polymorpha]|uniref:uncharacterized protein K02A2.6-like n=1 Tax=Dreissena polymorpha TaxID=45954 RepID=UPI0022656226|nr:uncharacterized protein K02A2.6-like [Dreissena polymorpha]
MASNFEQPILQWDSKDMYPEFQRFKQHVEFTFRGPLASINAKQKAGWLGKWINQQGRELYKTFTFLEGEADDTTIVLKKIEDYVRPRQNKRVSRLRAHQRKQLDGESFDNFTKDLRLLVMDCEYENSDDMLVDLIISGVKHPEFQERLLDHGQKLTINKAIEIGQQYELSLQQMKMMRGEEVLSLKSKSSERNNKNDDRGYKKHKEKRNEKGHGKKDYNYKKRDTHCGKCGKQHEIGNCPAFSATCNFCKKKNHWINMCRNKNKNINTVENESDIDTSDDDLLHINTTTVFNTVDSSDDKWLVEMRLCKERTTFRIDTGAKCIILVKSTFGKVKKFVKLNHSTKTLNSFTNHRIKSIGTIIAPLKYKDKKINVQFKIVNLLQENIISGETAEKLGLLQRIIKMDLSPKEELLRDFPDLVKTTEILPAEYRIKLIENAEGVIHAPRRIAASLKPRVVEKLHEMKENGYITPVHQPTEWVSSMVVSLKKDNIRICIDPKDLNKAIKREHHPMKNVDDVVSNIPNAKLFSVLDAKSDFLQIRLDESSSYLTTFNTPLGRYRWLRLPFGIKSAPEIYQRIMDEMLKDVEGAFAIIDDILIAGDDIEHHDKIFKTVIKCATEYNLKLNYDKCMIRQTSVPYMGHILSESGLKADPAKLKSILEMPTPKDKEGVRRFLGFIQYLAKFIPNLSQVDGPIRILLKFDIEFAWNSEQEFFFNELKRL